MISERDAHFHHDTSSPFDWCETNWFPFCIPEANILGGCYVLTRPVLGTCMSDITIFDRISNTWEGQKYVDNRQHLPVFESFSEYSLPNGLSVKMLEPLKRYQVDYEGRGDTSIHLLYRALMRPWDMNDPETCPSAKRRKKTWDWDLAGHYELTCHVTGEATILGQRHDVDCVMTCDRSWSRRSEDHHDPVLYFNAHFGQDFAVHALFIHSDETMRSFSNLYTGYVLDNGETYGIAEASGVLELDGPAPRGMAIEFTDVRGKRYQMTGSAMNYGPWGPYPSNVWYTGLMRYNIGGRIGYGYHQNSVSMYDLTKKRDQLQII